MPLFMLISGYLFAFSCKKKTTKELLVSKFKQLIVPLFCWSFVSLVIQMVKIAIGISSQKITLIWIFQTIYSGFWGGPWFLWALWWCSFIVIVGKKLFKDNLIFFVLVCLIGFVIPDANNVAVYNFVWPFFMLGYIFKTYNLQSKLSKIYSKKIFGLVCLVLFVAMLHFYNFNSYIYTTGFCVLGKNILFQIHNNCFRFLIGLVGSLSVMCLVYWIVDKIPKVVKKAFAYIGTYTLGIYLVSNYIFDELLKRIPIPGLNYGYIALEVVCVLSFSIVVTVALKKCKITNRLFLGGR